MFSLYAHQHYRFRLNTSVSHYADRTNKTRACVLWISSLSLREEVQPLEHHKIHSLSWPSKFHRHSQNNEGHRDLSWKARHSLFCSQTFSLRQYDCTISAMWNWGKNWDYDPLLVSWTIAAICSDRKDRRKGPQLWYQQQATPGRSKHLLFAEF